MGTSENRFQSSENLCKYRQNFTDQFHFTITYLATILSIEMFIPVVCRRLLSYRGPDDREVLLYPSFPHCLHTFGYAK